MLDDRCPKCGQDDLYLYYDETVWCTKCDWHAGVSCKEFFCPSCGSYEIRYEENRAICKECGSAVAFDCEGIVKWENGLGSHKILRAKKAKVLPGLTRLVHSFSEFTELEEVILPEGLETLDFDALSGCIALRRLDIPKSVRVIKNGAFMGCAFEEIQLPEGITEIEDLTFCSCEKLKRITIPEGVTRIGAAAFQYCTALEEVILPKNLEKIDENAFYGCTALKRIVIPAGTEIGLRAFQGCTDLVMERE